MAGRSRGALVEQLEAGVGLLVEQRTLSIRGAARVFGLSGGGLEPHSGWLPARPGGSDR